MVEPSFKSQCSSCFGWSYAPRNVFICPVCDKPVHKKCLKGYLGCITCCLNLIPGYRVTSYELNDNYNTITPTFNPYIRSHVLNQIGELTDEIDSSEFDLNNRISEILVSCKYQHPDNIKTPSNREIKILSLNVRSLVKNISNFREEIETFSKFDLICLNETNCKISNLPNGLDDIEIEQFYEPFIKEPARKSGKGGGLALYVNKRVCDYDKIQELEHNLSPEEVTCGEFQLLKINNFKNGNKTKIIVNFYRSPSTSPKKFLEKFENVLRGLDRHSRKQIVFLGDANIDLIKYDTDAYSQDLISLLEKYGFAQTVSKPTRVTDHSATLIDHVYTNHVTNVISCNVVTLDMSDHLAVSTTISLGVTPSLNERFRSQRVKNNNTSLKLEVRVFNEAYHAKFKELIESETWDDATSSTCADEQYNSIYQTYMKHYNTAYPLKRDSSRRKFERADPKPWILPWLEAACNRKKLLFFEKTKNPSQENCDAYDKMKKFCHKHVYLAKEKYYKKMFDKYQNCSKSQWKIINGLLNRNRKKFGHTRLKDDDGTIISSDLAVAEKFNGYFSGIAASIKRQIAARRTFDPGGFKQFLKASCSNSMFLKPTSHGEVQKIISGLKNKSTLDCKIEPLKIANSCENFTRALANVINSSFSSGIFPNALKTAKVVPIHKGGPKLEVANYRPISLLGSFSKIYEKLMHARVLEFLDKNDSLFENQYGFRPGRSCEHALLNAQNSLLHSLNKKQISLLLLLDYSKAFDVLDHETLLKKLDHYGIRGVAHEWFRSYLCNRSQYVTLNGTCSSSMPIVYGVPQGSILGPLLFVIYINDLPGISDFAKFILYADDANILISGTTLEEIQFKANQLISRLVDWVGANGLSLNVKKTCYMIFTRKRIDFSGFNLSIDNTVIERKTEARFLGVIVDEKLTWQKHITAVRIKMGRYLGVMYKLKHLLPIKARLNIFQSLIQSHLNFCSLVWGFASKCHIESLFTKQKQGIRAVMSGYVNYRYKDGNPPEHTKSAFRLHNILTVHSVIVKNALILLHKVRNMPSLLPKSIKELFPHDIPTYNSTYEHNLSWFTTYNGPTFRNTLFFKGPMLSITKQSKDITIPSSIFSIEIFKNSAKRELLKLQSSGDDENWPNFLLYSIPGLRKSQREGRSQIDYNTELLSDNA